MTNYNGYNILDNLAVMSSGRVNDREGGVADVSHLHPEPKGLQLLTQEGKRTNWK